MPSLPISQQRQLQQTECLAACAGMILNYLQIPYRYPSLVTLLQIGPAGAPFRNLKYLEKFNISVQIDQGDIQALRDCLERSLLPIVFVNTSELTYGNETTNHAIVMAGIEGENAILFDPAFSDAPHIVPITEFELAWLEMDHFYAVIGVK